MYFNCMPTDKFIVGLSNQQSITLWIDHIDKVDYFSN